jgi:hypothetical protein
MPRRKNAEGVTSALLQVQKQAQALLVSLRKEIQAKERELQHLKSEEASLGRHPPPEWPHQRHRSQPVARHAAAGLIGVRCWSNYLSNSRRRKSVTSADSRASVLPRFLQPSPAGLKVARSSAKHADYTNESEGERSNAPACYIVS